METPTLTPVVSETPKQKKPMSEAQLESLARAREKALEVRRAKAAAKKAEAENPPELEPVFHGETPPAPPPPKVPTGPSEPTSPTPPTPVRQNASSSDSDSEEDQIEAEVQRRLRKLKEKKKEKKQKKRARFVVEESESDSEEGEVVLVRKKPRKVPQRPIDHRPPNPFHSTFPRPGSSFRRF